jgi:hypothetical protein
MINGRARVEGKTYTISEGGSHSRLTVGVTKVSIPRRREIPLGTVRIIMRALESEFGRDWSGYER